jgi:uracil-DNA glycosylase family 4
LHRVGLANQAQSTGPGDGLVLDGVRVLAAVRCAPPANKPTPAERDACASWLDREFALIGSDVRVVVALGSFAWSTCLALLARSGAAVPKPRPRFGHGARVDLEALTLLGCFHPSQQNTFTGRLTERMIDDVLGNAASLTGQGSGRGE